jgi:hypothetical protein
MKAKSVSEIKFSFDKPLSSINDNDLSYKDENIKSKRSIFSKFKKEDHIKAGIYKNAFKYEYVTNNLNISIV